MTGTADTRRICSMKASVFCACDPSEPSMFFGSPTTMAATSYRAHVSRRNTISAANDERWRTVTP